MSKADEPAFPTAGIQNNEDSPFVDRLAAEFAKVREEQKEMDAKIADGMIDRIDAGKIDHDDIGSITALDIRDAIRRGEP